MDAWKYNLRLIIWHNTHLFIWKVLRIQQSFILYACNLFCFTIIRGVIFDICARFGFGRNINKPHPYFHFKLTMTSHSFIFQDSTRRNCLTIATMKPSSLCNGQRLVIVVYLKTTAHPILGRQTLELPIHQTSSVGKETVAVMMRYPPHLKHSNQHLHSGNHLDESLQHAQHRLVCNTLHTIHHLRQLHPPPSPIATIKLPSGR